MRELPGNHAQADYQIGNAVASQRKWRFPASQQGFCAMRAGAAQERRWCEAASATRFGAEKSAECVVRAGKRRCKYAAPLKANPASNVRIADAETRRRRFSLLTTVSRLLSASYTQNPPTPESLRTTWQSKYQLHFDVSYCIARGYLCYSRETNADLTDSGILDVQNRTVPRIGRRDWEMRDRGLT